MERMNALEEIKLDFEVISYIHQYKDNGIEFVLFNKIITEEENTLFRIEYDSNKEENKEIIEAFCLCRWGDRRDYEGLEIFLDGEIKHIEKLIFSNYVRKEYGYQLSGILKYFIMWKFREGLIK